MALKAKPPDETKKRLKMFMYGPAGVGKTTAAIQFPQSYIIDCEKGTENYAALIKKAGSVVLATTDVCEVIGEVKALLTEKHDFRTLIIDPITTIYDDLLDKSEKKVGSDFGRHYGESNKSMKRLVNLLLALDMNVIVTAHGKKEYGDNLKVIGQTFDGWKKLDYLFDLVIELNRKKGETARTARVVKTRMEGFPDQDEFPWSYQALRDRAGDIIEKVSTAVTLATTAQVAELNNLMALVRMPDDWADKCLTKAGVDDWTDMPSDSISKCIAMLKGKIQQPAAA